MADTRISKEGVLVIKAKEERSQLRNKEEALERLKAIIRQALVSPQKAYRNPAQKICSKENDWTAKPNVA